MLLSSTLPGASASIYLLYLLSLAQPSTSFATVHLPPKITAGSSVPVTLTQNSTDARFTHYEISLRGRLPIDKAKGLREFPSDQHPLCMLLNRTAIPKTSNSEVLTLQIPSLAVPAPGRYSLAIQEYSLDHGDSVMPNFSSSPSPEFELVPDGRSNGIRWADFESDPRLPYGIGDPFNVPCHAYDCVRRCFQARYPDFLKHLDDEDGGVSVMRPLLLCKAACPGVHTPREVWDLIGGRGDEAGDGGSGSDETGAGSDELDGEFSDEDYGEIGGEL